MRRVAIIGGGVAGIAAALRLAEAGCAPIVIETSRRLGGRATSFVDPRTGDVLWSFRHGGGGPSCGDSLGRRPVTGSHHHDAARQTGFAQTTRDELLDFTSPFTDHPDHDSVGGRAARQHAQQRALAHAGASEDAQTLSIAAGQHRINRSHARWQWLVNRGTIKRIGRLAIGTGQTQILR